MRTCYFIKIFNWIIISCSTTLFVFKTFIYAFIPSEILTILELIIEYWRSFTLYFSFSNMFNQMCAVGVFASFIFSFADVCLVCVLDKSKLN